MSNFARTPFYRFTMNIGWCVNVYGVAPCTASGPAGSECYNSFRSCQDKANFTKTTKAVALRSAGSVVPASDQSRPYIRKVDISPTEIDPNKGLAVRASGTVVCTDEPSTDYDLDPYYATRATPAGGSWWSRLLARHHYANVIATLERAYFTDGYDAGEIVTEYYVVEAIKCPTSRGEVTITVKDLLQLANRTLVPVPTPGKLAVALGTNDLQMTLGTGEGSYYAASGYVRVGDQIIRYTSNAADVLSWPDSTYRSQFGTTAVDQDVGDGVQQCTVFTAARVHEVIESLCNESGIADANIDLAGNEADDDQWLGSRYEITACLSEPTEVTKYLEEIAQQTGGCIWLDPEAQKVKYRYIGPQSPGALAGNTLTRSVNLIDGQTKIEPLDSLRLTRAAVYYNLVTATSNLGEGKNFLRPAIYIDADAESDNEYGDVRNDVKYSRWFTSDNDLAMSGFIARRVGMYRDVPRNVIAKVDSKDNTIREGEYYDVTTAQLTDMEGAATPVRCLVVKRKDNGAGLDLTLRTTNYGSRRYGFIAPNGTADYNGNGGYACVCLNTGKFSDGSDGYRVI